jgi:CRISPR-associated protein Cas2
MSADKKWRLVCYDVSDPKRYRRLHKVMKGVGHAVQYSVFRCRLDDRELEQLRWKLAKIVDATDRLLVVDLCPSCARRVVARNHVEGWAEPPASFAIVGRQGSAGVTQNLRRPRADARDFAVQTEDSKKDDACIEKGPRVS